MVSALDPGLSEGFCAYNAVPFCKIYINLGVESFIGTFIRNFLTEFLGRFTLIAYIVILSY